MSAVNPLNVYTGPDSLKKYFDPDSAPPLPLVELPPYLNPYYEDGVRIYGKIQGAHPAHNVKAMPAMKLLSSEEVTSHTRTICEYSSGSTVISMSMVARIFHGIDDTRAFLSNKTSGAKLRLMQFFGINITLFGGPSQPEPTDERGGIRQAAKLAEGSASIMNPNQYENDLNWKSHIAWTGPQILKQLPEINVICAGMGTSGTMTGLGQFFKQAKPSVHRLGVCTAAGDRVPGPRSYALLSPVQFPWKEAVDSIEEVGSVDSFTLSLSLCRNGIVCGPSSGFNLQGLFNFLEKHKAAGTLSNLASPDGLVHSVFLTCDLPYPHVLDYFEKLGPASFPVITNENLAKVDLYRYDEAWELPVESVLPLSTSTVVLDFRNAIDYYAWHLPFAVNVALGTLQEALTSPFCAADVLERQWTELEKIFSQPMWCSKLEDKQIICLCYHGDTARVATSVLRAKGFVANSMKGGALALSEAMQYRSNSPAAPAKRADSLVDEIKAEALESRLALSTLVEA